MVVQWPNPWLASDIFPPHPRQRGDIFPTPFPAVVMSERRGNERGREREREKEERWRRRERGGKRGVQEQRSRERRGSEREREETDRSGEEKTRFGGREKVASLLTPCQLLNWKQGPTFLCLVLCSGLGSQRRHSPTVRREWSLMRNRGWVQRRRRGPTSPMTLSWELPSTIRLVSFHTILPFVFLSNSFSDRGS